MGGRLLTLAEARHYMKGKSLYPDDDQWAALYRRDWIQVGDRRHFPGKSWVQSNDAEPDWADQPYHENSKVVLYKTFI